MIHIGTLCSNSMGLHLIFVIFISVLTCYCHLHLQIGQILKNRLSSPSPPSFLWWYRRGLWTRRLMAVLIENCPTCRPPSPEPRCLLQANARPVPHPAWAAAAAVLQYVQYPTSYVICQKQSFSLHGHVWPPCWKKTCICWLGMF